MRSELQKRASEAVATATRAGAADAWATASRSRSVSFQVRNGKLEEVKDSTSRSLSVRLYVDGRYSAHSTTDLRAERVAAFVDEAVAMTRALQPDRYRELAPPALFSGRPDLGSLDLVDSQLADLSREQRLEWIHAMNKRVAGKENVISATSAASNGHTLYAAASSNGFTGEYESTSVGMYTSITLQDGDKRPQDWMGSFGRHQAQLESPAGIADRALRLARGRLGMKKGPTLRTAMVVDNRAAGGLIGRLLGAANGGAVQQERSFWRGRLGEKNLSGVLTITDDPLIPRGLGSRPFDGEGIAARRLPLVAAGVMKNLYVDTYYGRKLGMDPTTGSGSNQVVTPGKRSQAELLAAAGKGVFVTSWLGGNIDSSSGDFSMGVRGNLIENGKLGAPVGEMNVTGNIVDLFAQLREVGSDTWPYSSVLSPSLLFDGVQFSGA